MNTQGYTITDLADCVDNTTDIKESWGTNMYFLSLK